MKQAEIYVGIDVAKDRVGSSNRCFYRCQAFFEYLGGLPDDRVDFASNIALRQRMTSICSSLLRFVDAGTPASSGRGAA